MKLSSAVKKETMHIAIGIGVCSAVMLAVFLLLGQFSWSVLLGTLLGAGFALLNFFLLGVTVQKATSYGEAKAKNIMKLSYNVRLLAMAGVIVLGMTMPWLNWVAVALPQIFPRITIAIMGICKFRGKEES